MSDTVGTDGNNSEAGFTEQEEVNNSLVAEGSTSLPQKIGRRSRNAEWLRTPRQRYCVRWEKEFPWLRADNVDECLGICIICHKRLVCKKSHLERHEKSFKHQRLTGFEYAEPDTQNSDFLECSNAEIKSEVEFVHAIDTNAAEYKVEIDAMDISAKKTVSEDGKVLMQGAAPKRKVDRYELLKRIERDRCELNEYYYAHRRQAAGDTGPAPATSRDSFDLFFESVSASTKTLPPKLAAEVKSRISQIMVEFELRAICEREAMEKSASNAEPTVVVASTTHELTQMTQNATMSVPHIVYTYQPKLDQ